MTLVGVEEADESERKDLKGWAEQDKQAGR
jgi:hypothetical protein